MYFDLLVRIKNAVMAKRETVHMPFSKFDFEVAKVLAKAGYLAGAEKRTIGKRPMLEMRIASADGRPKFSDFRVVSKPSRHLYRGYRDIRPVKQGYGVGVYSTPSGIVDNRTARKKKLGGEYLFEVW